MKKIYKLSKKIFHLLLAICIGLTSVSFNHSMSVLAEQPQKITLSGGASTLSEGNYIKFYNEESNLMGKVEVRIGDTTLIPFENKIELPAFVEAYQVEFHLSVESGYEVRNYLVGSDLSLTPGEGPICVSVTSGDDFTVTFNFEELDDGPAPDIPPLPSAVFPILAYFSGVPEPVEKDTEGNITVPVGWTSGTVSFKAKTSEKDGKIVPYDSGLGAPILVNLNIIGINNRDYINKSVSSDDGETIIINEDFINYGKTGIHLGSGEDINTFVDVITENLIAVSATAPMNMAYSYGATMDQTLVTNRPSGDVSIFFGNNNVNLKAAGPKVSGITNLTGAVHTLNSENGSVDISLPPLSVETTTSVILTIKLDDNSTVTRKINIIRTAIELSIGGESNILRAGYVMNKGYLYNNQPHNDSLFDAYLQVILYRDNKVAGYRQIQIDDEEFVNNLEENEGGSIESIGDNPIILYEGEIEGVNKASVFLTNGPIDFTKNALPSIEFGLGAGVQIEWGNNK